MKSTKDNYINTSVSSNDSNHSIPHLNKLHNKRSVVSYRCESKAKVKAKLSKELNESKIIMHISCMNCGSNVPFDEIDRHASRCIKVTAEIMKNEKNKSMLRSIDYKLKKLKEHLTNMSNNTIKVPKKYDKEMRYVCPILTQCITNSLHLEDISLESIKKLKKIIKDLDALLLNKEFTLSTQIYIDRTRMLIDGKLKTFREPIRHQSNTRSISKLSGGIGESSTKANPETLQYMNDNNSSNSPDKRRVVSLTNSGLYEYDSEIQMKKDNDINQRLTLQSNTKEDKEHHNYYSINKHTNAYSDTFPNEIISYDSNKQNCFVSTNSSMSYSAEISREDHNCSYKDLEQRSKDNGKVSINVNTIYSEEEKLKKEFYRTVFKIKFTKLHSSHKGQHVSHYLLWNECIKQSIPQDNWKSFIIKELNNPNKYSLLQMKNKKKFLSQNFTSMPIIDEENM